VKPRRKKNAAESSVEVVETLIKSFVSILFLVSCISYVTDAQQPQPPWFKGNTHTHTLNSDGDSTSDEVVKWYRHHGYNFLSICLFALVRLLG
jgi:hypothetical protein